MKTRRRLDLLATTVFMACVAIAIPTSGATATAPPAAPEPATTEPPQPDNAEQSGVVQSWALAPAVAPDAGQGGARSDLSYVSAQGAVIEDAVTLFNLGTDTMTFRVYATDAFNNDQGQFDLLAADDDPSDVGSWVSVPQELITVPAGTQVTMPITITIPADATPGDHVGAILASSPSVGSGGNGQVVTLDRRTGTRIYLRVDGPLFAGLVVSDVETEFSHALNPLGGSAHVTYRVENRGNVRLSGTAELSVSGPFGLGSQQLTLPDVPELLPGEGVTMIADLDGVPAGFFDLTTVRVTPAAEADVEGANETVGTDRTFAPPLSVLFVMLALLFALLAIRAYQRHRSADPSSPAAPDSDSTHVLEHQPT